MDKTVESKNKSETFRVTLLFLFFFSVIAAFWTLKPLRTSSVVKAFGADLYPLFKQGSVFIAPVLVAALTFASSFCSRDKIIYIFTGLFLVLSWVFWFLFEWSGGGGVKIAFFFYVDGYITMMVALFFAYLNDTYDANTAKNYYGIIGLGGLTGGIVGSSIAGWLSQILGNHIILTSTIFLVPIFFIVSMLHKLSKKPDKAVVQHRTHISLMRQMTEGVSAVFRSKYLLAVLAIVGIYEIISTNIDYNFNATLDAMITGRDEMASYQGKVFFFAQIAALGVQAFLTVFIHRKFGIVYGLLFLPFVLLVGSAGFMIVPILLFITLTIGGEMAFSYSINQSSKEILYVPLSSTEKYKGKAFIDIFGFRFAKALGAGILLIYTLWLRHKGVPSSVLMGLNVVLILIWFYAIWTVHQGFKRKTRRDLGEESCEQ